MDLAQGLEVSARTVYRDIDALRRLGVGIEGEAGFGYVLTDDHALPPLMFTSAEVEALALGLRKVIAIGDSELASAAEDAMTKLGPVLPDPVRSELESGILLAHCYARRGRLAALEESGEVANQVDPAMIRQAARKEQKQFTRYQDQDGRETERVIWPLAIAYLDTSDLVIAWCELRDDFRTFRLDRLRATEVKGGSFRPRRVPLLRRFLVRLRDEEETHRRNGKGPRSEAARRSP
jgi:predicted DNA-binding transcriptional regulator YafY